MCRRGLPELVATEWVLPITFLLSFLQGHVEELWGLATHPSRAQFVTCGQDKLVHLWSSETHQPVWSRTIEDPARSAGFHPSGSVLAVGTVTGRYY